jgi:hypothetical protein
MDHVACVGEMRNAYRILIGKHEGRENNIKMDLREMGCNIVHWICLAQDRGQESVTGCNELLASIRGGEFLHQMSDYQLLRKESDLCSTINRKRNLIREKHISIVASIKMTAW